MSENKVVKGYKVFNPDWTCRGIQYEVGKSYEIDEKPIACTRGFHFCQKLNDCFSYYSFNEKNKVAEVIAYGEIDDTKYDKLCTNKIKIQKELSWSEVLDKVNTGKCCTGRGNSGDRNTGNYNTGDRNTGYCNTGDLNTGDRNTGYYNTGNWNTGSCNIGYGNIGNWNTGHHNTGDCNNSSYHNGCFNTKPTKIYMFNKLSNWTMEDWLDSKARKILIYNVLVHPTVWVKECDMTDGKKRHHPEWSITGGYLKKLFQKEIFYKQQENWNHLKQEAKDIVMAIPNFDKEIFKEITGIDITM